MKEKLFSGHFDTFRCIILTINAIKVALNAGMNHHKIARYEVGLNKLGIPTPLMINRLPKVCFWNHKDATGMAHFLYMSLNTRGFVKNDITVEIL